MRALTQQGHNFILNTLKRRVNPYSSSNVGEEYEARGDFGDTLNPSNSRANFHISATSALRVVILSINLTCILLYTIIRCSLN